MDKNKALKLHTLAKNCGFAFVTYNGFCYSVQVLAKIALGL